MANPQLEDGHTRIANELLESLARTHLTPYQWRVLLFIARKTYGFQKKLDYITTSQVATGTGIYKTHVSRAIKELVDRRILTKVGRLIGIQKDYELWLGKLPKLVTIDTEVTKIGNSKNEVKVTDFGESVTKIGNEKLPKLVTKVTTPLDTQKKKENIQKKPYKRKLPPNTFINQKYSHVFKE